MTKQSKAYKQSVNGVEGKLREQLLLDYAPLVKYIAGNLHSKLPAHVDVEDLISEGMLGLMDAIAKYDPTRDNKFRTYAEFRIKGAILDDLRKNDWMPRSARDISKLLERTTKNLEQMRGGSVSAVDIANHLNISLEKYFSWLNMVKSRPFVSSNAGNDEWLSFDDISNEVSDLENELTLSPLQLITGKRLRSEIIEAIDRLSEPQRVVITLSYFEGLNLAEIGRILDVTESRVSQIRSQAKAKLKVRLRDTQSLD